MNLADALSKLHEDIDVVRPFAELLLRRVQEKHPRATMRDITIKIEVVDFGDSVYKLLDDMVKESVGF